MLDQFIKMAADQIGQQLHENPNVPTEEFNYQDAAQTAGSSIFETIAGQMGNGDLGAIQEMLSGAETSTNNPLIESLSSGVINNLSQKNGLSPDIARTIASIAIPFVLNMFNQKASSAQSGGMDIGGLLGSVLGGGQQSRGGGLLGGLLGSVLGGNRNQSSNPGADMLGSILGQVLK